MTANLIREWHPLVSTFLKEKRSPLIVILGPTASGKTGCSIEIAKYIEGMCRHSSLDSARDDMLGVTQAEIVNADSRQLYRHLNIGTAKITEAEIEGIPHHLIDVLDPNEEATAGWFQKEARGVIEEIQIRGAIPILVGGSMLYVSAIIDELTMAPVPDAALRERLMKEYDADAGASLHRRLQEIDPETAEKIHPNNKPRLVRAVEIFELTRTPKSAAVPQTELRTGIRGERPTDDSGVLILGMHWSRAQLMERIDQRTIQMFEAGWIEEVRSLLDQGYGPDDPGMKSHGYREIIEHLQSGEPTSRDELIKLISAKSRQYARRQVSWWRRDTRIHWLMQPASARLLAAPHAG